MVGQFLFKLVLDSLFPLFCIGCKSHNEIFCENCLSRLSTNPDWINIDGLNIWSAFSYSKAVHREIIQQWKYPGDKRLLATLAHKFKPPSFSPDHIIVPIPLHRKRIVERGFNQAYQLAEVISEQLNLDLADIIKRNKYTKQQAKLEKTQRAKNVQNAFTLKPGVDIPNKVILVDDVVTTGSTILECTRILQKAGVSEIVGITLFRKELS